MKITWYVDVAHNLWLNFRFSLVFSFFVENESNYIQVHKQNWSKKPVLYLRAQVFSQHLEQDKLLGQQKWSIYLFCMSMDKNESPRIFRK